MREGSAIYDFMNPDRVVLGSKNADAAEKVAQLHLPLRTRIVITDLRTAEMIKYASNAFLATKISFINEIAAICEKLGADVQEVAVGMGYDKRIGPHFLNAGLGYGGSCFPKDVKALEHMALVQGSHPALLRAVMDINRDARRWADLHPARACWAAISTDASASACSVWPSSPTPTTSANRPRWRLRACCNMKARASAAYDPVAMANAARENPELRLVEDPYELAEGVDALVVCTEWNEFKQLDLATRQESHGPADHRGRAQYLRACDMMRLGFIYRGVGRGQPAFDKCRTVDPSPVSTSPENMSPDKLFKTRLGNGLQIILQETHVAPVASFWIFYRVGSRNELPGAHRHQPLGRAHAL